MLWGGIIIGGRNNVVFLIHILKALMIYGYYSYSYRACQMYFNQLAEDRGNWSFTRASTISWPESDWLFVGCAWNRRDTQHIKSIMPLNVRSFWIQNGQFYINLIMTIIFSLWTVDIEQWFTTLDFTICIINVVNFKSVFISSLINFYKFLELFCIKYHFYEKLNISRGKLTDFVSYFHMIRTIWPCSLITK